MITKDLIRNVVVPSKSKTPAPICISKSTIESVRQKSKVRTRQEIQTETEDARNEAENALAAAAQRKLKFEEIDLRKQVRTLSLINIDHYWAIFQENAELNDLEREAKILNEGILEKAKMQRLEQEDEIKHLNELMLNAKVILQ